MGTHFSGDTSQDLLCSLLAIATGGLQGVLHLVLDVDHSLTVSFDLVLGMGGGLGDVFKDGIAAGLEAANRWLKPGGLLLGPAGKFPRFHLRQRQRGLGHGSGRRLCGLKH